MDDESYDENGVLIRDIWKAYPVNTWTRIKHSIAKDMVYRLSIRQSSEDYYRSLCLWYNGARWVAWIPNLFVCEPTDFKDPRYPPFEWAECMNTVRNN
jgi:hypothetical protein